MAPSVIDDIIKQIETVSGGDGDISFEEFIMMMRNMNEK